jgi:hypothetical protein
MSGLSLRESAADSPLGGTVKLELISVALASALVPILPSNAQSTSPAGHYTKKVGGQGEMFVQKTREG